MLLEGNRGRPWVSWPIWRQLRLLLSTFFSLIPARHNMALAFRVSAARLGANPIGTGR
jgi:hypothetical protein